MKKNIEQRWEESIASQDTNQLVESLFWEDARYLNLVNGRHTAGYEELLEAYVFIELSNIPFSVKVLDLYVVRDDVVYIIGQYHAGSIQNYYTLIYTKNERNPWKNMLDTNYERSLLVEFRMDQTLYSS